MRTTKQILSTINSAFTSNGSVQRSLPKLVCDDCARVLDLTGATLALMDDGGQQAVVGASHQDAARLEELQFELGEGPSVDASRESAPVLHPEFVTTATTRWPAFGPAALDAGVRAVFAFPLQVGAIRLGSLGMYRSTPGTLAGEDGATALAYADAAVVVLLQLQAEMQPGEMLHPDLAESLEYRAEVHQATGFLSVQESVSMTEALLLLRAHAFANDRQLLHVARDVLAGALRIQTGGDADE